ncbi:hypothetical protein [Cohnella panacarvi]|uniref:hypothetical protein n=1 Tax=Cohnella panacarvi TaxID=400776 RepID=UPI0004791D76|nr:hypothetical protein [Cohnella panacarvi]
MSSQSGEDQVRHSLEVIGNELQALLSGSARLRAIYGEAAIASDLTFVKILEEQYKKLSEDIGGLSAEVGRVQLGYNEVQKEAVSNGR